MHRFLRIVVTIVGTTSAVTVPWRRGLRAALATLGWNAGRRGGGTTWIARQPRAEGDAAWRRVGWIAAVLSAAACTGVPPPSGWQGPFDLAAVRRHLLASPGAAAALPPPPQVITTSRVLLHTLPPAPPVEALFTLAIRAEQERREITTTGAAPRTLLQLIDGGRHLELEQGVPTGRDLTADIATPRRDRHLLHELLDPATTAVALAAPPGADLTHLLVLERTWPDGERWQAWFDAGNGMPLRIRRLRRDAAGDHVDEDLVRDPVRVGERLLPRHVTTWHDRRRVMESFLLERDETTPLADALFLPADAD